MALGRHLRELWAHRPGLIASVVLATLAALWSVGNISLIPPGVHSRALHMGAASTRVLVDAPTSSVLDLGVPTANLQGMTNRAVLVGNVIASAPVRQYIARRAHVPAGVLRIASPVTPDFPRPLTTSGKRSTRDIVSSPDQYRLSVQANPTVPILDIYAQAPSAGTARALANGAVEGMQDYLRDLAQAQRVPPSNRVHLEQLGRATGATLNPGVSVKLALLSFLLVFAASAVTVLAAARIRRGWAQASASRPGAETAA